MSSVDFDEEKDSVWRRRREYVHDTTGYPLEESYPAWDATEPAQNEHHPHDSRPMTPEDWTDLEPRIMECYSSSVGGSHLIGPPYGPYQAQPTEQPAILSPQSQDRMLLARTAQDELRPRPLQPEEASEMAVRTPTTSFTSVSLEEDVCDALDKNIDDMSMFLHQKVKEQKNKEATSEQVAADGGGGNAASGTTAADASDELGQAERGLKGVQGQLLEENLQAPFQVMGQGLDDEDDWVWVTVKRT